MKHKVGDIVRIVSAEGRNGVQPIAMYLGQEAEVEHINKEAKLYVIRVLVPPRRGIIRFNVTQKMIEPEINEEMLRAGYDAWIEEGPECIVRIYQVMRELRWKEQKRLASAWRAPQTEPETT